jgi:hypothetical protein
MTIPIRLTLYIIYITPINCYPISSPPHLKQLQEVSLFHIFKWSPSNTYLHFNLLHSNSPSHSYHPPYTWYLFYSPFFIIWVDVQRAFSMYPCYEYTLVHSIPSITLPYPFNSHPHFSTVFNTYSYILYLHRCYVLWY